MFQTLTGSLIILMVIGCIIVGFALFAATVAMSIWRKDEEEDVVADSAMPTPSHRFRKAA